MRDSRAEDFIPHPTIIMFGCQSLDAIPARKGKCPVCGPGVKAGDDTRYCGKCDSVSPAREAQIKQALLRPDVESRAVRASRDYQESLASEYKVELSESERRRLWNGCTRKRKVFTSADEHPTNEAMECRKFLKRIGQVPDWSLVRDKSGRWAWPA